MPRLLDGPRLPPKSGTARQLVVFLHGYGADGNDLIDLGQQWQTLLPDAAFVSPHAPQACAMSPMGRQWFGLTFRDPDERWLGAQQAAPDLDAFLDSELARHNLDGNALALVGFSQGAMMALHIGLRRTTKPGALIGYSGHLVGREHIKAQATHKPPILLVHGSADEVVPVDGLFDSLDALGEAEIPCQWHLAAGLGHGIDPGGLYHGGLFLAQNFGLAPPETAYTRPRQ